MPYRRTALAAGEVYHVFNRGVNKQQIFWDDRDYERAINSMIYYSFAKPQVKYSHLNRLLHHEQSQIWKDLQKKHEILASLIAFVLMPNHYHFLIKQTADNGVSRFLSNWQNSFSKYINVKHDRTGHLFQGPFKAVRVTTNPQLLHLSRYIHLNPYTGSFVKNLHGLEDYVWSSFPEYIGLSQDAICEKDLVLAQFKDSDSYKSFVFDQANYQKSLKRMKDLMID
ncbi:transposase [Candidatus Berkelbacteria bacterium]|nr:transposase [Candidatus Berkelbacteria bacterium]